MTTILMARDGADMRQVDGERIRQAFDAGKCRIVYSRGNHHTKQHLSLNGDDFDTRGECYSVWEEAWTHPIESLKQVMQLAFTPI
jgi:hypothetical protein